MSSLLYFFVEFCCVLRYYIIIRWLIKIYIRKEKRKDRIYISIVHGYRDGNNKVKHKTIKTYGYLDELEKLYDNPMSVIESNLKKLNEENINELILKDINKEPTEEDFENSEDEKNIGYFLLKKIYSELGITNFLKEKQKKLNIDYDLNEILLLLVLCRILYPGSKKENFQNRNKFFEKFDFSLKDIYRALDFFDKYKEDIQKVMWENTKDKYQRDLSTGYFDCTNYYFEIDCNDEDLIDEEGNILEKGYRKRGPEKNHRPDPIVEMGLLLDNKILPASYKIFPGNDSEKVQLRPIINKAKTTHNIDKIIVVADRGLNTSDNMWFLAGKNDEKCKNNDGYVYGQSVRGASKAFKEWVLDEKDYINDIEYTKDGKIETFRQRIYDKDGNFKEYKKNTLYFKHKSRVVAKEIQITKNGKRNCKVHTYQKQMVYYSQKYADKQRYEREKMIEKAKDLIANPTKYTKATSYGTTYYIGNISFNKDTGEIVDGKTLYLDEEIIKEQEKFDGYYAIVTSELEYSDQKMRDIYRELINIENSFKITKTNLEARPVYVWTKEHIEGHFLTCFISLVILRLIENRLNYKYTIENIIKTLRNTYAIKIKYDVYQQNNPNEITKALCNVFELDLYRKRRTLKNIKKIFN